MFQLIPLHRGLWVEGHSDAEAVADFAGMVLAVGLRDSDPVATAAPEDVDRGAEPEGLLGWGTTYFLVADPEKPAPVWIAKNEIEAHSVVDSIPAPRS